MDRMGDVVRKTDEAERALDMQILNDTIKKNIQAEKREQDNQKRAVQRYKELQIGLKKQVEEQQKKREKERRLNDKYVKSVNEQVEKDLKA